MEYECYQVPGKIRGSVRRTEPEPRFENEEERKVHRDRISRTRMTRLLNANFGPNSLYVTLTFEEDEKYKNVIAVKKALGNFIRRLQYKEPQIKIIAVIGAGEINGRLHIHMVTDGIARNTIEEKWTLGEMDIKWLRNYGDGRDYRRLAHYMFDQAIAFKNGHRYRAIRNLDKPEKGPYRECSRTYSEENPPDVPDGYRLIGFSQNKYGYENYRFVLNESFFGT